MKTTRHVSIWFFGYCENKTKKKENKREFVISMGKYNLESAKALFEC